MQSEDRKRIIPPRMMNYAKNPYKSTIHLYRGLSTRSLHCCRSWTRSKKKRSDRSCTGDVHTRTEGRQTFPLPRGVYNLSSTMECTICLDNNASEAEVITDTEFEEGDSSNSLTTWAKMQRTEFTCPQRRNEFWQTKSKPSLCTSLHAGRMRCESCQRKQRRK